MSWDRGLQDMGSIRNWEGVENRCEIDVKRCHFGEPREGMDVTCRMGQGDDRKGC